MLWSTVTPTLTYALESGGVAVAGSADPALEFIAVSTWGAKGGGAPSFFLLLSYFQWEMESSRKNCRSMWYPKWAESKRAPVPILRACDM